MTRPFVIRHVQRILSLLACVALLVPGASQAQTAPELASGVQWLNAQVGPDGALANEAQSIALPFQARSEAMRTLQRLATVPPALGAAVIADADDSTEFVARRILALAASHQDASALVAQLQAARNPDGGFGGAAGYASNALDTAWALQAFKDAGYTDGQVIGTALAYLEQSKHTDGGWGADDRSSAYVTASVLIGANAWRSSFAVGTITASAASWLQANTSGGAFGSVLDNAHALAALVTQTADAGILGPLQTALKAAQGADGSWSGDPYLTAVALRALWLAGQPPSVPTTGDVLGAVVDSQNVPIANATVSLVENPSALAATAANGSFALRGLAPGAYTLQVAALGYGTRQLSINVVAGQTLNTGTIGLAAAPLTASLTGYVKDSAGRAVADVLVAIGAATAVTDATGKYTLASLEPGAAVITVAKSGYETVTVTANLTAGTVFTFSPTLYASGTTPSSTSLRGKVVDASTNAALANAVVSVGAATTRSGADGSFTLSGLSSGSFVLSVSLSGYNTLSASGTLAAGVNDVGVLGLTKAAGSSTLAGLVTDASSGAAIAGATVAVGGTTLSTQTSASGAYQIAGIVPTSFQLSVSADGYTTSQQNVTLAQPGTATLNVKLVKVQPSAIVFDEIKPNKTTLAPTDVLEVEIGVQNTGSSAASILVEADVFDAAGNVVGHMKGNPNGTGDNPVNAPMTFPAGSDTDVELKHMLNRQEAGAYSVIARGYDANGVVVAEARTEFSVAAQPLLGGGVVLDPPLMQAGTGLPVKMAGQLGNYGNQPIPAGNLKLEVTLVHPDTSAGSAQQVSIKAIATGAPLGNPRGFARDSQGNLYTVNNKWYDGKVIVIHPDGKQEIFATVAVSGVTVYLNGVTVEPDGKVWVSNYDSRIFQVGATGVAATVRLTSLDSITDLDNDGAGNLIVTGRLAGESRLVKRSASGTETVLWANGLANPVGIVKDGQGNLIVSNYGDGTLSRVSGTGQITPFASGFSRPMGLAIDAAGNLYVANNGNGTISKIAPGAAPVTFASGLPSPVDVKAAPDGSLFVTAQSSNAIYRVGTDGKAELFAQGLANSPQGMKYDASGNLFITNNDGTLREYATDGTARVLATGLSSPRGLDIAANGDVFVANYSSNAITRFSQGAAASFAKNLANPYGVALDASGNLNVTEYGANAIRRLDASGNVVDKVSTLLVSPDTLRLAPDQAVYVRNTHFITVVQGGAASIFFGSFDIDDIAPDLAHGGLVALRGTDLYRIDATGTATKLVALGRSTGRTGLATDMDGNIYVADYYARKINKVDTAGTVTTLAVLTGYPRQLLSDLTGQLYLLLDNNKVYRVAADGTLTAVYSDSDYIYSIGNAADARLLVQTSAQKIYAVNPADSSRTVLKASVYAQGGMALDATGRLWAAYGSNNDVTAYGADGSQVYGLSGFRNPLDIVWTGSELRFADSDGRLFRMQPGEYPVKIGSGLSAQFLTQRGADTYATYSSWVYQWNGGSPKSVVQLPQGNGNTGLAGRMDGTLAVADGQSSRVVVFDTSNQVVRDFAGLAGPEGLAFDAQGRMYVANNSGSTIGRFDAGATVPQTYAKSSYPQYLAIDPAGNLYVSHSSSVEKITPDRRSTTDSAAGSLQGLLADGTVLYGANQSSSYLRKSAGQGWQVFAAGLANPTSVRWDGNGGINVANSSTSTVTHLADGKLTVLAGDIAAYALAQMSDGRVIVTGNSGAVTQIAPDGTVSAIDVASMVNRANLYGAVQAQDGSIALAAATDPGTIYRLSISQPTTAPAAGTVVYSTQVPVDAMDPVDTTRTVDLGQWVPPYSGDYAVRLSYPGVDGLAENVLHVGPNANATLTAAVSTVAPGDQKVPMALKVNGADFTTISRVETGLVRKLTSIARPAGMVGDRAGNIWYTDSSSLKKTTPAGVTSTVVTGIAPQFGLAVDSQERFYLVTRSGSDYKLMRVAVDGTSAILTSVGSGATNGVAVNSADEVLIGQAGRLLKYAPDSGQLSVVGTAGIPSPLGIAVDGKDNVYVQNGSGFVTMIKPDGSATTIFSKSDGTNDPQFEGDGYPTITADCADNFYITAYSWSKIGQYGEEHVLGQVIPRTGAISALFNGLQVSSHLQDIDYLAYDRFGNRLLMWVDDYNEIWQVPVTCGAISVEAHVLAKPGQQLSGFSKAPSAVIPQADGRTEYVWSLRDVTAQGASVNFDAALSGMKLGETRSTIDSGFLLFKNTFAADDVKAPIAVPAVSVSNLVNLTVSTDKAEYLAGETAAVAVPLVNANAADVGGELTVDVYDAAGVLVGSVQRQSVTLPANRTLTVNGTFGIGVLVPGTYVVKAVLNNAGVAEAAAQATLRVLADKSQAAAVSTLSLDKLEYAPGERVTIASRATNQSANAILDNLLLTVTVVDSANNTLSTKTYPVAQLLPGVAVNFTTPYALQGAAAGTYQVLQVLSDANGQLYDTHSVAFKVGSTADTGFGLAGTLSIDIKRVPASDPIALTFSVTNGGNSAIADLPLTVSIIDPVSQKVIASFPYLQTLAIGVPYAGGASWTTVGEPGTTYVAVLSATVGGKLIALAQDTFTLIDPPVKLDVEQAAGSGSRVLVLASCGDGDNDAPGPHGEAPACATQRASVIDQALVQIGAKHTVVTDAAAFTQALRSGFYNTYWLSGKQEKLGAGLVAEVVEAVNAGRGLLLDGVHDERNKALDQVAGIRYRGKIGETDLFVDIAGGDFEPAHLQSVGRALTVELDGATPQAAFAGARPGSAGPALVLHQYGAGQAVLFGFDLAASLAAQQAWQAPLASALKHVLPAPSNVLTAGEPVVVRTTVTNQAKAVDIVVQASLPPGAAMLDADPAGAFDAQSGVLSWHAHLAEQQKQAFSLTLGAPSLAGDYTVQTQVFTGTDANLRRYGDAKVQALTVSSAAATADETVQALQALALDKEQDRKNRDRAVTLVQAAMAGLGSGSAAAAEDAVAALAEAAGLVAGLPVDASASRRGIDLLLREAEWRWWRLATGQPPG